MKRLMACVMVLGVVATLAVQAQDAAQMPEMPKPVKEHEWLEQLVGEWDVSTEVSMEGIPPMTMTDSESVRAIGGFWVLAEGTISMEGKKDTSLMTLGFDVAKGKYVGTWVGSMADYLWNYTGSVDKTGKVLTLNTEGPCPMKGGKMTDFKEVIEIRDENHRTFTSSMKEDDGSWTQFMKMEYTRKK